MANNPAETYENYIVPALFAPWADELARRANPQPGERLLDVACGTGIVVRRTSPVLGQDGVAHGVDPNPAMLAVAAAAAEREGRAITWSEGRAEKLPYPDGSFDLVTCQQGAQFFADRPQGFTEMRRVLDDDGRAAVSTWQPLDRHAFFNELHESMQRHLGTAAASAPFTLGEAGELQGLLEDAGFAPVEVEQVSLTAVYPDPDRFLAETVDALMAVVSSMLEIGEREMREGTTAIKADLQAPLAALTRDDHVHLPWHCNIALAQAA